MSCEISPYAEAVVTTRRDVLQIGAWAAASAAAPAALASRTTAKTILILGGTGFIGPHLTQEALRRGWKVTHFNRGKRTAGGVAGVETLIGDRKGQLDSLRGRRWGVVVDDTGYIPKFVKMSAELLAPNVGYCLFISSISAYASFARPNDEHSPTGKLSNADIEEITDDTYGPMKALCEQYSAAAFTGRVSIVRPGYIVGPLDPTDRFTLRRTSVAQQECWGGRQVFPLVRQAPISYRSIIRGPSVLH